MRVVLFTGKGGVGKTTVAASTAVRAARDGKRTLVMSTDPAHSLGDSFDVEIGSTPTLLAENLWAQQIDAQERLEDNWREIQDYFIQLMNWAGTETIQAEELTVLPGLDEIFALIDVKTHVESGLYDMLVVDCAPTAETLRLLSLPEIMNWYIERIFPVERRIVKTVRPLVSKMTTLPIAGDQVFAAVERLHRNLDAVKTILTDERVSSVRLVVNLEKMVIAEARRTYTYLGLFGYRVDAVVVNRIIPEDVVDPYFGKWKSIQAEHLVTVHELFEPVPILAARLFDREMVGISLLEEMGDEVYGERDASAVLYKDDPIRVRKRGTGYVLSMRLPFVSREDMDIHRRGEELFVRVGSYKRNLILPQTLKRMIVREANFAGDHLEIMFGRPPQQAAQREGADMAAVTTNGDGAGAPRDEDEHQHEGEVAPPPPSSGATGAQAHACNVAFCPIGLAISAVQPLRPDAVEHLLLAGRELFLAMRTIVDARADQFGGPDDDASSFEKIDIG